MVQRLLPQELEQLKVLEIWTLWGLSLWELSFRCDQSGPSLALVLWVGLKNTHLVNNSQKPKGRVAQSKSTCS